MAGALTSKPGGGFFPGFILFIASFFLLLFYSVSPTVYAGDSSLFTAASYHLGSAHHPGYPLLALLGKVVTFIPIGNIAFRVNILSALFGALTVYVSYECAYLATKSRITSILAPLVILSSPLFILESSKIEAYALNALFMAFVFYLCLKAILEEHPFKPVLLSFFIIGLGMGNHHIIAIMFPLTVLAAFLRFRDIPKKVFLLGPLFFIAGFSVYIYLFLRSAADTLINYSRVDSIDDFIYVLLRRGYASGTMETVKGLASTGSSWLNAAINTGRLMAREIYPIFLVIVAFGIIGMYRNKKVFLYILSLVLVWIPLAKMTGIALNRPSLEDITVVAPYFLPLVSFLGVIAAVGFFECIRFIDSRSKIVSKGAAAALLIFQAFYVPIAIQKSSLSDYYIAYGWMKDISRVMPPKSFYLSFGDNASFLGFYGFGVERMRDDVLLMDAEPGIAAFRLIIAPKWKYSYFYPDFYKSETSRLEFFSPVARQGRLYASSRKSVPQIFKDKFTPRNHVLSAILLPAGDETYPAETKYKEAFAMIDYLPVIAGYRNDSMTAEINDKYAGTVWEYAKLLSREQTGDWEYYFKLAFLLGNVEMKSDICQDYIRALYADKGEDAVFQFIMGLKMSGLDEATLVVAQDIEQWFIAALANAAISNSQSNDAFKESGR